MNSEAEEDINVFNGFDPEDFEFSPPSAVWVPPCWISVPLTFRAITERAKAVFIFPMKFDFQADAFARRDVLQQFSSQFFAVYEKAHPAGRRWTEFLWDQYPLLQDAFANTSTLFRPPFRFVPLEEFTRAPLDVVLREDPELFDVYLADDTDSSKRDILILRIHSSLWLSAADQKHLWYEKRVPWRLHDEDLLPWFDATVKKLPRKGQPADWSAWTDKLVRSHPELLRKTDLSKARWENKPPIGLVFGTRDEVGFASVFHLERQRIQGIRRSGKEILIKATIANRYEKDPEKLWWTFRVFCPGVGNAERLEERFLSGEEIHFGIGDDISGIIATNGNAVHFINVDSSLVRSQYSRDGMILISFGPQRYRHKTYFYYAEEPRGIEEIHRL